ncbi:HAD family hydrolase [Streptomyces paromomycinus]|uniref:Haloacid dehalogenase n=1 Tax=Streptomyces paromomycinus TaxID=92743 RepID=A0A401VXI8_STREY|nr:HAD family phosphatase [Streptomyces paromomycinus]GCD41755.1 haloacid dehalogenase [Streptomyces paromomycinus]
MSMISLPEPPAPHAAVVFDCDGLLVNTQGAWDRAYEALFAHYGRRLARADRHGLVGLQLVPLGHRLADLLGHPAEPHILGQQLYELVQTNLGAGHAPMPGAVDLVYALAGTRPLAVASNTPAPIVRAYLEAHFDLAAFDAIRGSDTVARPKPAPDLYLDACAAISTDPHRTIAFEDSPTGAAAALAAGLYLIAVPSSPDLHFEAHLRIPDLTAPELWDHLGVEARRSRTA